jgi:hypothetical protein
MRPFQRPIAPPGRSLAVAAALALAATACGTDSTAEVESGAGTDTTETTAAATGSTDASATTAATTTSPGDTTAPPAAGDHVFPDLDTVEISTGATVNLADQLAGGDTPILLWFFAPH